MKYPLIAFPSLAVPVLFYALAALFNGGGQHFIDSLATPALSLPTPSGMVWNLLWGDLWIVVGLAALFIDLLKATGTGPGTVMNHAFSMALFILCLVLFLLVKAFVSSAFFVIMTMTLLDVVAGFTITIISARRDVTFENEH